MDTKIKIGIHYGVDVESFEMIGDVAGEIGQIEQDVEIQLLTLSQGLNALKDGKIEAFVSTGNTKCVVAKAQIILRGSRSISAYLAAQYDENHILLDVGATINPTESDFVRMASMYPKKRVGLLNVGSEGLKGDDLRLRAYRRLYSDIPNFVGNVEGHELHSTNAEVILTDAFTGNILLKAMEAYGGWDWESQGGVQLLGLKHPIFVGHGRSTDIAVENLIYKAISYVEKSKS